MSPKTPDSDATRKLQKELNAGASALVVLALLVRARRPMYGYEIAAELASVGDEGLPMNQGALYPVLRSLERGGLLESTVEASVSGPPRKYYAPTKSGRQALPEWQAVWKRTRLFVDLVLEHKNVQRNSKSSNRSKIS